MGCIGAERPLKMAGAWSGAWSGMQQKGLERLSGKSARSSPLTCSDARRTTPWALHYFLVNIINSISITKLNIHHIILTKCIVKRADELMNKASVRRRQNESINHGSLQSSKYLQRSTHRHAYAVAIVNCHDLFNIKIGNNDIRLLQQIINHVWLQSEPYYRK